MVGEIRDFETAEIAVKAALTGHLVLSTLHTNDAPGTISRLLNMGIEPFLVAASVILIASQRLSQSGLYGVQGRGKGSGPCPYNFGFFRRRGKDHKMLQRQRLSLHVVVPDIREG